MPYVKTSNGRIESIKMEFNLVENCNYACKECSHFSPYMPVRRADLTTFETDVSALSDVYHVRRFRFVGGEPLLHKDINAFVAVIRDSGITDTIEVVTNGSLLDRVDDELFRSIDYLSLSWYPDKRCDEAKVLRAKERCRLSNTTLKVQKIDHFRLMQLDEPIQDDRLTKRIFDSCQIAHSWYCQTFAEGYFYLCSRPLFTPGYLRQKGQPVANLTEVDGLPLHTPDLYHRLSEFLGSTQPLSSCRYCLGTVGKREPWRQLDRSERRATEVEARVPTAAISRKHLWILLVWAALERAVLRLVPSLNVSRVLNLAKNWVLRD